MPDVGRLVQKADFERLLASRSRSRSAHFAVHHVDSAPMVAQRPGVHASSTELSTDDARSRAGDVDSLAGRHWLGSVVPKRHARRAVTRNLLKRQIRVVMAEHCHHLPGGLWLVRLRAPFPREHYPSAASDALRRDARAELQRLFAQTG